MKSRIPPGSVPDPLILGIRFYILGHGRYVSAGLSEHEYRQDITVYEVRHC